MTRDQKNRFLTAMVKIECDLQALSDAAIRMKDDATESVAITSMIVSLRNHAWLINNRLQDWPESGESR